MLSREDLLRILRETLPELRKDFGVIRLALYGSFARGKPRPDSDVDLLVEFSRPPGLTFIDLATFETFHRSIQQPYRQALGANVRRDLIDVEIASG